MRMCSIASGSSGNCIYIGSDNTHLLVDTGISKKRIEAGLTHLDITGDDLDGILITHEHIDHIQGLGVFSRKYEVPVYATSGTIQGIKCAKSLGKLPEGLLHEVKADETFRLGDLDIVENLKNLNGIVLEANHDIHMLEVGPYPYPLKRRVMGDRGHLSNELSGRLLCDILHDDLGCVMLGHLSKENNYARLAYETVKLEVTMGDNPYYGEDLKMMVAERDQVSEIIRL